MAQSKGPIRVLNEKADERSGSSEERISDYVGKMDKLGETRRLQYSARFLLAAASQ
jgi:hypothetical protein